MENCAFCIENITFPTRITCKHVFCGQCLIDYYDSIEGPDKGMDFKCPLCRTLIRNVVPLYSVHSNEWAAMATRLLQINNEQFRYLYMSRQLNFERIRLNN